jgi:capsular exopolysaccharide synthesis family protein
MSDTLVTPNSAFAGSATQGAKAERNALSYGFAPSIVTLLSEGSPQADAIRALRTHIMARHLHEGRRALAICAPSVDVGCSFVAANLAVGLSQIGVKTLLIDGDLRRPALDQMIRPPRPSGGLVQALKTPDLAVKASIDADVLPNFSIMYAGQAASNSQELLATERFKVLMNYCLREYDATIVDTPPANASSDARRISGVVGYSLIVAAKDKSFLSDIRTLNTQLRADRAVVVGTVLNGA